MNEKSRRFWSAVAAGAAFGSLTGLVLGLSLSPLVANFLAPLLAIVTAVLGLKEGDKEDSAFSSRKTVRATTFAVFSIIGIFSGMWVRVNDALSPNVLDQIQRVDALHLEKNAADEIKASLARRAFLGSAAVEEGGKSPDGEGKSPTERRELTSLPAATSKDSVLFGTTSSQLAVLDPSQLRDSAAVADLYLRTGGFWAAVAKSVNDDVTDEAQRMKFFNSFWNELQKQQFNDERRGH
jgi:hypothetical protein